MKVPGGNTVTPTGDIQTPYDYKIAALGQSLIERTTPKDVAVIPLAEEGKGIYSARSADTSIPGTYVFEAILDWDVPLTGHVHARGAARGGREAARRSGATRRSR